MSTQTYTVTSPAPIHIYPAGQQNALSLSNGSVANTVYVGDSSVTGGGFPLSPGSVQTWDAGRPLYAYVDDGKPVALLVLDNGGGIFNAGAIASQIIQQGLAGEIAAAITLSGVPTIDQPTMLTQILIPATTGAFNETAGIDVTKYQSILFQYGENTSGALPAVPVPRRVQLTWFTVDGTQVGQENLWLSPDVTQTYATGAKGARLSVFVFPSSQLGSSVSLSVTGSFRPIAHPIYGNQSAQWVGDGLGTDNYAEWGPYTGVIPDNDASYPPSKAGRCSLRAYADSVPTAPVSVYVDDLATGTPLAIVSLPVGAQQTASTEFILPNRPIRLRIKGTPVTNLAIAFVYSD